MDGSHIDDSLLDVALRSFKESLEKATHDLNSALLEYSEAEQRLREAAYKRDKFQKDCDDLARLISSIEIRNIAERSGVPFILLDQFHPKSSNQKFNEEDEDEEESDSDGSKRKRKRLHARPKTLEVIQNVNRLVSVEEVIDLVKAVYAPVEIQDKTIKNAVWDLTASEELIKFYSRNLREYIYGIPQWFDDNGNPKPEYARHEVNTDNEAVNGNSDFFDFEDDSELPF